MAIVTKPVLLDETGKDIRDALDSASSTILAAITDGYNKDMTLQEVVDARGNFTSLGQRLTYQKEKTDQLEEELEETLQDVKDYVDDAADKILADITDEFNIDGTLQEVVDARGDFVSLGQRLDSDDERLGVLEQTTKDLEYWKKTNNALPKVEGEGTDITLDNTANSPLTLGFKASENTQNSTSGKNLCPVKEFTSESRIRIVSTIRTPDEEIHGIPVKSNSKYFASFDVTTLPKSDYRIQFVLSSDSTQIQGAGDLTNIIRTNPVTCNALQRYSTSISTENKEGYLYLRCVPTGFTIDNIQIEESGEETDYEPYTNGASPNPEYPQDIHVVKGDNEIRIFDNSLYSYNTTQTINGITLTNNDNKSIDLSGTNAGARFNFGVTNIPIENIDRTKKYTFISNMPTNKFSLSIAEYNGTTWVRTLGSLNEGKNEIEVNPSSDTSVTKIGIALFIDANATLDISNLKFAFVEKIQKYTLSLGGIGKNKFNIATIKRGFELNSNTGLEQLNTNWWVSDFIYIKPNTQYTSSNISSLTKCWYDKDKKFISRVQSVTATSPSNARYLRVNGTIASIESNPNAQIEEGSVATNFEEYQTIEMCNINNNADEFFKNVPECEYYDNTLEEGKWYKYGRFGKLILNGTEEYTIYSSTATRTVFRTAASGIAKLQIETRILSTHFIPRSQGTTWAYGDIGVRALDPTLYFTVGAGETIETFKEWVTTNNVTTYYPLETPKKTLLSDTLQEQLDNISYAMAYQDQTNISQNNEDRPFVISASTVLDLKTLLTNMN